MNETAPPGMRWQATEYGDVLVKVKRKAPEGNLKKRCQAAFETWKERHPDVPARLLKYSVGNFKNQDGQVYALGTPGAGDLLIGIAGTCLMVETKSTTGRQRDAQVAMERDWTATGNRYLLARDVPQFIAELDKLAIDKGWRAF